VKRDVESFLRSSLPPDAVLPQAAAKEWRTGPGARGLPAAVVAPGSEEELAEVLKAAGKEGWTVLPSGNGRWLQGGGSTPVDVVITTRRMKQVMEYEPADLTITAGAGLTLRNLDEATEPHGQWLPLDPPGGRDGTLGSVVALGAWGPLRAGYGRPRDHVLGLTMVSGEGKILRWGGRVVKNVAGFDLTRLIVGSWGTLGVVTSVSTRLFPLPAMDRTLILFADRGTDLVPVARALAGSGLPVAALELADPSPSREAEPACGSALIVRLLGTAEDVGAMESRIRSRVASGPGSLSVVEGIESEALHEGMGGWEKGADLVLRLSLLPSDLGVLLEEANGLRDLTRGAGPGEVDLWCHVVPGLARVAVRGLPPERDGRMDWAPYLQALRARLQARGGEPYPELGSGRGPGGRGYLGRVRGAGGAHAGPETPVRS